MKACKHQKSTFFDDVSSNVVREFFQRHDVMLVRNLFRLIGVINCTNSRQIWTPTSEDMDHIAKTTSFIPSKKIPMFVDCGC